MLATTENNLETPVSSPDLYDGDVKLPRRTFLHNALMASLAVSLGGGLLVPDRAFAQTAYSAPVRARGTKIINVRDTGALGDGIKDDTAAIQAAINNLGTLGGTVTIPAGIYLVDAIKSIRLRSKMKLELQPGAILKAKPNSQSRSYVIYLSGVSDVEISGGEIIGERDGHLGTTGEWGMGIQCRGSRISISNIKISRCWGDGVCIGGQASDVVLANVISTGNRRQGLSITNCSNIKVYGGEFSDTNGTAPQCGIDVEPDSPYTCSNVLIKGAKLARNNSFGLLVWNRVSGLVVEDCIVEYNHSNGMVTHGCKDITVRRNAFHYNGATGFRVEDGSTNVYYTDNTSGFNYTRLGAKDRVDFTQTGWTSKIERDVLIRGTVSNIQIQTNRYT